MSRGAEPLNRRAGGRAAALAAPAPTPLRSRSWAIVGALAITETVSWGILNYAFAVLLAPMRAELGFSTAQLTGAFSLGLLVAGLAGIPVGRYLDRHSPRPLMTAGSIAGVILVIAWSQVDGLVAFYALWVAIGIVMATVLYEPAFIVLAKEFRVAEQRRQAMTALTLAGALASFIFLPLTQALIDAYGWRDALLTLGTILAVITIPLHALVLRAAPPTPAHPHAATPWIPAGQALRARPFWLLAAAFALAAVTGLAMTVHSIPFLLARGHSPAFAAFAVGLIGISQIPGRLLFAPLASRLPRPAATAAVFVLIAAGIAILVSIHATWAVIAGLVLLGMGNGMSTLARAMAIADLFGSGAYGTIASVMAFSTTAARAAAPVAAAAYAAALGYVALLWTLVGITALAALLAYRAERIAGARAHWSSPEVSKLRRRHPGDSSR